MRQTIVRHSNFDSHFVSCLFKGKCRGHFGFCLQNLLVSNAYSWSTKLLQIRHIIVSGILIVAANIKKTADVLDLKVKKISLFSKTLEINLSNKKIIHSNAE